MRVNQEIKLPMPVLPGNTMISDWYIIKPYNINAKIPHVDWHFASHIGYYREIYW